MPHTKAIVCASGGMDSLVTIAVAAADHQVHLLHVRYGQRTQDRETQSFNKIADHYGIEPSRRMIVDLTHLVRIGGSSLTDRQIDVETNLADNNTEIPSTYVPFRNANIICIAASWAEVIGATDIYLGVTQEDSAGYPDCRQSFLEAMEHTIDLGTKPQTKIHLRAPLIDKNKTEIVKLGRELNTPFELSWSCYTDSEIACGCCDSCRRRLRAFQQAGIKDPVPYKETP